MTAGTPDPKVVTPAVAPAPAFVPAGAGDVLLQLMWLASPALPVGGFSYSEGLEGAVEAGFVHDETRAREWLIDQLHLVLARGELAVVAKALAAWQRDDDASIAELNAWMTGTRESS